MNDKKIITLEGKSIGKGKPVFIIAEAGFNHNGSLDLAIKLVDAAKEAGVDCVKFQKREVENLATKDILDSFNPRFADFGSTYRQARSKLELSTEEYAKLIRYCNKKGIIFLCTPFDIPSAHKLKKLGVKAFKIASHSLTNLPLIEYVAKMKIPTILSTGMATLEDVEEAVDIFRKYNTPLIINHCISSYPSNPKDINLSIIPFYDTFFEFPIGYSGHESGISISLAAASMGAVAIERHFTLDKNLPGPDHKISLVPNEFKELVSEIRLIETAVGFPRKQVLFSELATARKYHYSIVAAVNIKKGSIISERMLTTKNPGIGLPPRYIKDIIGKKSVVDIPEDELIQLDMIG